MQQPPLELALLQQPPLGEGLDLLLAQPQDVRACVLAQVAGLLAEVQLPPLVAQALAGVLPQVAGLLAEVQLPPLVAQALGRRPPWRRWTSAKRSPRA